MAYGICRIKKLHASNLTPSAQHVERKRTTLNADPERQHICIIGEGNLETLVRERIGKENISKIRKNAVMAVEFVLTASPEYFRPSDPSQYGDWEVQKLEAFQTTAQKWLLEKYGDRIVKAELHLDEATPHIHAYFVPIDDRGKLNCRGLFGTRSKLSKLQDSFAKAMSPLGLERGIQGSKAVHTDIKKYYTTVNRFQGLSMSMEEIERLQVENSKLLRENRGLRTTIYELNQQWEVMNYQKLQLEVKIDTLLQQVELWNGKYKSVSSQTLDKPLKVSLSEVALQLGLRPIAKAGEKKQLWQGRERSYVITGNSFQKLQAGSKNNMDNPNKSTNEDRNGQNNGQGENGQDNPNNPKKEIVGEEISAIDLVMEITHTSYEQVVTWFYDHFGDESTYEIIKQHAKLNSKNEKVPDLSLNSVSENQADMKHGQVSGQNQANQANQQFKQQNQTQRQQGKEQNQHNHGQHDQEESEIRHHTLSTGNKQKKSGGMKR
jgi:Plasmid recombination enzyme